MTRAAAPQQADLQAGAGSSAAAGGVEGKPLRVCSRCQVRPTPPPPGLARLVNPMGVSPPDGEGVGETWVEHLHLRLPIEGAKWAWGLRFSGFLALSRSYLVPPMRRDALFFAAKLTGVHHTPSVFLFG